MTRLAVRQAEGTEPGFFFLTGLRSSMNGEKAQTIAQTAAELGAAMTRFDYRGHGESDGAFEDGTIALWLEDALQVLDTHTTGRVILVGSSMGGWLAVRLAQLRPARVAALLTLAAAPDFVTELLEPNLTAAQRAMLEREGRIEVPSRYEDRPYTLKRGFIEAAAAHRVLQSPIALAVPVHLIHGRADKDVPIALTHRLAANVTGSDIAVTEIRDGEHRLSRPQDLALIAAIARHLHARVATG